MPVAWEISSDGHMAGMGLAFAAADQQKGLGVGMEGRSARGVEGQGLRIRLHRPSLPSLSWKQ